MSIFFPTPNNGSMRLPALAIGAAYSTQALGYASVMTSLPTVEDRWHLSSFTISLVMLGACLAAAVGSGIANAIAVRSGTKTGMIVALIIQSSMIICSVFAPNFLLYGAAIMVYGIGLGLMDASQNAQAVSLEASAATSLMGKFYAAFTAASMVGALLMSMFLASSGAIASALIVAALVDLAVLVIIVRWLHPVTPLSAQNGNIAVAESPIAMQGKLPVARIFGIGSLVLAAYMLDSAVSSWSSIYLATGLHAAAALAPLGYAAYQGAVFITRLVTDRAESKYGRMWLGVAALVIGTLGCVSIAVLPTVPGAVLGFCLAGIATGITIPIAISAAGMLMPARRDEVITRVNLFNYAGAILGAVTLGLVASGPALGIAFLIPGIALLAFLPMTKLLRANGETAPTADLSAIRVTKP